MSDSVPTFPQLFAGTRIAPETCTAIRALRRADRSNDDVRFMLELDIKTVRKHAYGRCSCPADLPPVSKNDQRTTGEN